VGYVPLSRLFVTLLVTALVVLLSAWMLAPDPSTDRHGDPRLLSLLATQEDINGLAGLPRSAAGRGRR